MSNPTDVEPTSRLSIVDLEAILENTTEGFALIGADGIFRAVNQKGQDFARKYLGKELRIGESVLSVTLPHRKESFQLACGAVLQGETISYDIPAQSENGDARWFNIILSPAVRGETIEGICISGTDVTERVQARHALMESEQKHRLLSEELAIERGRLEDAQRIARIGSWELDIVHMKPMWSAELFRIVEADPATYDPTYDSILEFVHPDDRATLDGLLRTSFLKPGSYSFEHRGITAKGNERYVVETWNVVHDERGIPVKANGTCQDITERKKAQDRLHYKAHLLNTIGQAVVGTDLKGTINYWNLAAEKMYGWPAEEAIGQNIIDVTPAEQSMEQAVEIMEQLKQGKSWSGEFQVKDRQGRQFPAMVTDAPIFDRAGAMIGIVGVSSDISHQRRLEGLLEKVSQVAQVGGWEVDVLEKKVFWSDITCALHEVDIDYVPNLRDALQFYNGELAQETMSMAVNEALHQHTPFDLELPILTAKGNERWVRVICEVEVRDGRAVRLYGSFQDIHSRKSAEISARRALHERNDILESIGDAFFAVDKNWTVTYWNKKAEEVLLRPKEEVLGRNLWEVYADAVDTPFFTNYHAAINENRPQYFEAHYETLNRWMEVSAYPSEMGLSVYFKNITEKKEWELQQAKLMYDLVRRNKDLEQFSYIVSHNLRAPVANIIGLAAEIESGEHPADVQGILQQQLSSNAQRLDGVISDLNEILRIRREAGQDHEAVGLLPLVDNIRSSISHLVQTESAEITIDFSEADTLIAQKGYLHSIFYNLISNSIKYREPSRLPRVHIETRRQDEKVLLSFTDNGSGIDLKKKGDQVFGLYKRFHQNSEGKGMGLYMVKTQVEALGGSITLESTPGEGSRFEIAFPQSLHLSLSTNT